MESRAEEKLIGSGTVTFNNPAKNISHITFFDPPGGQIPDGGTTGHQPSDPV
jgi:hypothetical protein